MIHFNDLPSEVVDAVLEHLDQESLSSTAIVASSLQYPSERLLYRTVKFKLFYGPPYEERTAPAQETFLRTVSLTERRAHHVNLLALQKIEYVEDEERATRFGDLEGALKAMVNLKKLSVIGTAYIRQSQLRSPTFSLTHLSIHPACSSRDSNPDEVLMPILKAHPELRWLSLRGVWSLTRDDVAAIEEQRCNLGEHSSSILCPRLEYVDSSSEEILQSLLYGRRVKHMVLSRSEDGAGERWGSVSMLPGFSCLEVLVLLIDTEDISEHSFPITMARHLISLTRLNLYADTAVEDRSVVHVYTSDPLLLPITQIQTLQSLTLSATPRWCGSQLEQEDIVRFLYRSCPRLKEAFVQHAYGHQSHSHYGVDGKLAGVVGRDIANKGDYNPSRLFR